MSVQPACTANPMRRAHFGLRHPPVKLRPGYEDVSNHVDTMAEQLAAMLNMGPEPENPTKKEPEMPVCDRLRSLGV
jgi:hypothetical protein